MKRITRSMDTWGLKITLCVVIVFAALLGNAVIEPPVAQAQRYIVDLSLGDNPVPSGTGTSITISIGDDWIYDTYNSTSSAFSLRAWVYMTDAIGTHVPRCHGSDWPSSKSITPNNDGNRMVITAKISGSCPLRGGLGYTTRVDVMARIEGTDTVVANRTIRFTVEGVPPTATPTATATATPGDSVENPPEQPTQRPTSAPGPATGKPEPPPPTSCIVAHAATPVQVCRNNEARGLHFFFVGAKGVFSGPKFPSITEMMSGYPFGYVPSEVELYRGTSTGTGKKVLVHYLTYSGQLRVSTYYADNKYDVNKPYVFIIDQYGTVTHLSW